MTRKAFLEAYRKAVFEKYSWAQRSALQLEGFMAKVTEAIEGSGHPLWNVDGPLVAVAWQQIGGDGIPTIADLRRLP